MSRDIRIIVDCDGTVGDFLPHLLSKLGWPVPIESATSYKFQDYLTPAQYKKAKDMLSKPNFWSSIPVSKGAKLGIKLLEDWGYDVVWCSSPWLGCTEWEHTRRRWLQRHFNSYNDNIVFTSRKELLRGDFIIEDKPETIKKFLLENPSAQGYLVPQPYNSDETDLPRFQWTTDINTLLDEADWVRKK